MANRLEIFAGGHTWPPGAVAMDALSWLELQAMKKGLRTRDDGWIAAQFAERCCNAPGRSKRRENPSRPMKHTSPWLPIFAASCDVAPAETAAARLDRPAEIEKYRKALKAAEKEEDTGSSPKSTGRWRAFMNTANARERRHWLDELGIPGLRGSGKRRRLYRRPDRPPAAGVSFSDGHAVAAVQAYEQGDMKSAGHLYELTVLIQPSGYAWYNLACVHSRLGEKKDALRALETAVRNGMTNGRRSKKTPILRRSAGNRPTSGCWRP